MKSIPSLPAPHTFPPRSARHRTAGWLGGGRPLLLTLLLVFGNLATVDARPRERLDLRPPIVAPTPAAEARQAYGRELQRTEELFEAVRRDERQGRSMRVRMVLLVNQIEPLNSAFEALRATQVEERSRVAGMGRIFLERHDATAAQQAAGHRRIIAALSYLAEALPSGRVEDALDNLEDHFEKYPTHVRIFTARQAPTPLQSMEVSQDIVDISGLRAAGRDLPVDAEDTFLELRSSTPPTAADLAETVEVVFTPEIIDRAAALDNDPLKIYAWVKNTCDFDPYLGSRRGADETRRLRAGNDMDIASLLIALLRVSGYPARYGTGIVQMTPEQAMNWLGVDDANTAGSILTTAGLEGLTIVDGPDVVSIRCRRVWVEAYLPYSNYRGTGSGSGESAWVPLDAAMKTYENSFGLDLRALSSFDPDAFVADYVSTLRTPTVAEYFAQTLSAYAATNFPGLDFEANRFTRAIAEESVNWLPGSLPYRVLSQDGSWAEIPADKRFKIRFHIYGSGATLDHTVDLPAIAGKQVTLSYVGATPADVAFLDANGGVFGGFSPSLVKMRPQLKIDGCLVADGTGAVTLGIRQTSDITFTTPAPEGDVQTINNTVLAGNYEGHAFATGRTVIPLSEAADTECPEDFLGFYLHRLGMQYLDRVLAGNQEGAELMQAVVLNNVYNAIVGQRITVAYDGFGNPLTFDWFGLGVDADRGIVSPFSTTGADIGYDFLRVFGAEGSLQENRVFEEEIGYEAVSTIKILSLASDLGIPLYTIDSSNAGSFIPLLTHASPTISKILSSISAGKRVTIPRDPITYFSWNGTGYIDLDPTDGGAGYIISGGGSGGDTVDEEEPPPGCQGASVLNVTPAEPGNTYSDCDDRTITIEVEIRSYDEDCNVSTSTKQVQFTPASLGAGSHPFNFGGGGDCGGCTEDSVTIIVTDTGATMKDSNGRSEQGNLLQIVPPRIGETITCSAPTATGEPEWQVSGVISRTLTGKTVTFRAANWLSNAFLLYDIIPQTYTVTLEDCAAPFTLEAYSNKKGAITFGALDVEALITAIDALNGVVEKAGSPLSITPSFAGQVSFENEWKEKSSSNLVAYTWTLGGEIAAGVTAKVKFGTGLIGLPPPLAEAAVFVSLGGKIGLKGTASLDTAGDFQVEGGSFGSITLGVGGEVSIGSGFVSITLVAESGIGATAFFGGTSTPPEVYAQTKIEAGQLDISYKVGSFWGLWESSETWRAWDPWTVYDNKVTIFPWN